MVLCVLLLFCTRYVVLFRVALRYCAAVFLMPKKFVKYVRRLYALCLLCACSVCLHACGSFLGVVLRAHGVASTSLRQQSYIRRSSCTRQCSCDVVLAVRRVRHSPALFTLDNISFK